MQGVRMAWPPVIPPNSRVNATPQSTNHPDDHNKISNALTDIVTGPPWAAWTPVLTVESGTNPSLGAGAAQGRYIRIGKLCIAQGIIRMGSGASAGSGNYVSSLPVNASTSLAVPPCGSGFLYNGIYWPIIGQLLSDGTRVLFAHAINTQNNGRVSNNAPFNFGAGSEIQFEISYETA